MQDKGICIKITQRRIPLQIGRWSVPFYSECISNGSYLYSDGTGYQCIGEFNPLECLNALLINAEFNRKEGLQGPIHAAFKVTTDSRSYVPSMEKVLEIYARSEHTAVTFEHKGQQPYSLS